MWWSEQNFCRSLQACSHFVIEMFELETAQCLSTHLAHADPVDARLSPELLHHQPLLLDLLKFSLVRKHDVPGPRSEILKAQW